MELIPWVLALLFPHTFQSISSVEPTPKKWLTHRHHNRDMSSNFSNIRPKCCLFLCSCVVFRDINMLGEKSLQDHAIGSSVTNLTHSLTPPYCLHHQLHFCMCSIIAHWSVRLVSSINSVTCYKWEKNIITSFLQESLLPFSFK